jgi:hypothetical protein
MIRFASLMVRILFLVSDSVSCFDMYDDSRWSMAPWEDMILKMLGSKMRDTSE